MRRVNFPMENAPISRNTCCVTERRNTAQKKHIRPAISDMRSAKDFSESRRWCMEIDTPLCTLIMSHTPWHAMYTFREIPIYRWNGGGHFEFICFSGKSDFFAGYREGDVGFGSAGKFRCDLMCRMWGLRRTLPNTELDARLFSCLTVAVRRGEVSRNIHMRRIFPH